MDQLLLNLEALPGQLRTLLLDPTSNLTAALLLYAVIGTLFAILLLVAIMFLWGGEDEEEESDTASGVAGARSTGPGTAATATSNVEGPPKTAASLAVSLAFAAAVLSLAWIVAGYSTSTDAVCISCHQQTVHSGAQNDPHVSISCVACHEPGGVVARYTGNLPARVLHFADAALEDAEMQDDFGRVTQSSCVTCHDMAAIDDVLNAERGLRMSHAEPLAASVTCLDCHSPASGVVAGHNAGMNTCLRCHDAKTASSECVTCHDRKASVAARSEVTTAYAAVQVQEVRCGSCHDEKRECDTCHGTRLPHSKEFMTYAHARAGAVDLWYNDGETCAKCHNEQRRPCQKCHTPQLGSGHGPRNALAHQDASAVSCNSCHIRWAYSPQRDFCLDVCHTPTAIKESPR